MKFLVCITQVPDTTTKIQFNSDNKDLNKTGVTFILNPYDDYALNCAIDYKEANAGTTVTVLCVGPSDADQVIRKALAVGADNAVRINAESRDGYFIAQQIANHFKENAYDVILMGKESIDRNGSEVSSMVAELADIPSVTFVSKVEFNGSTVTLRREADGVIEHLEGTLPILITAQNGISEWRLPNMRGIMSAKTKPLAVAEPIAATPQTATTHFELPPQKQGCVYIDPANVAELVKILSQKGAL